MASVLVWVWSKSGAAGPFILLRVAADDGEVALVHAAGFEQFAVAAKGAGTFREQEDASGFGIYTERLLQCGI